MEQNCDWRYYIVAKEMENDENLYKVKNLMKIAKEIYSNNGLDMSPLENLLNEIIDEDKIRNSRN